MFDIGGWELLVIGSLALIIVGPKDLPRMIRNVGQWVGKARGLAREFQSGMEQAAREADLDDVAKAGREVRDSVSSLGADTKRMLDTPATASSSTPPDVEVEKPRPSAPVTPTPPRPAGAVSHGSAETAPPPRSPLPPEPRRDPPVEPTSSRQAAPAAAPDGRDDDILDSFERGMRAGGGS
ncbi:MAG: Sec-independent protein translocase protein TatB [Rhodobacteraceae bacterium]|nr:Sec-independent protein translocase protein TatB [Paracoccaceae bacterium]